MTEPNQTADTPRTNREYAVVHLDDDRQFLTLTEQLLGRYAPALRYRGVTTVDELEQRLADVDADCVVVDHGRRGVDAAAVLASPAVTTVPVVVFGDPDVPRDETVREVADASVRKGRGLEPFERLAATLRRVTGAGSTDAEEPTVGAE